MSEDPAGSAAVADQAAAAASTVVVDPAASVQPVDWFSHVPKEIQGEKFWEPVKGKPLSDVLKNHAEQQKFLGQSIRLPNEKDKPEEAAKKREDIYNKLGRPARPDEYKVTAKLPEGLELSPEHDSAFRTIAHKAGLNNEQMDAVYGFYGKYLEQGMAALGKQTEADEATLKEEWGPTFKLQASLATRAQAAIAKTALGEEGAEQFMDLLHAKGMGANPLLVKIFAHLGAEMNEDKLIPNDGDVSAESLHARLSELEKSGTPFWDARHPDHDKAVADVNALRAMLNSPGMQGR